MAKNTSFQVGDIVKLKSGGPEMTVQKAVEGGESFWCQWFAGKKLERGLFPGESLEPVTSERE